MRAGGQYVVDPALLVRDMRRSTFGLWAALNRIDSFDGHRDDLNAATISAAIMAAQGVKKNTGEPFYASDFMPFQDMQKPPEAIAQDANAQLRAFLDARVKKKA